MAITLTEVAQRAGVGIATASYALNGTGGTKVSAATRAKVLQAAKELNYRANTFARSLKQGRSYLIGGLFPVISHDTAPLILQGMEDELNRAGYGLIVCTHKNIDELKQKCDLLLDKRIDGLIVLPEMMKYQEYYSVYKMLASQVPLVCVAWNWQNIYPRVAVDGYALGSIGVEFLIKHGHRRIAIACEKDSLRATAYRDVLKANGLEYDEDLIYDNFDKDYSGGKIFEWIMSFKVPPSAIFCLSLLTAAEVISSARSNNIAVPEDLSVLGTDDASWSRLIIPKITTVFQPQYEQGVNGVKMLLQLIDGKPVKDILLKPHIIARDSVCSI